MGSGVASAMSGLFLRGATDMLRSWPGVFDLLPTYKVIYDPLRDLHLNSYDLAGGGRPGFAADPFYEVQARRALETHDVIDRFWAEPPWEPGGGPITVPFLGRDHGTLHEARLEGSALGVAKTDPGWQPNPGWHGDGTVPALSAIPPEMASVQHVDRWHYLTERHVPMAGAHAVVQMVRSLVGDEVSAVRGSPIAHVRLGVDLDDSALVGEPFQVAARLLTGDRGTPTTGVRVFVTVQPEDRSTAPVVIEAEVDETGWQRRSRRLDRGCGGFGSRLSAGNGRSRGW